MTRPNRVVVRYNDLDMNEWELEAEEYRVSVGTDVRRVAELALSYKAAACIVAHNHPDGEANPSPEDRLVTDRLRQALGVLGIPLHDHIIIGSDGYFSFADAGLL